MLDFDAKNNVVSIEVIGQQEFSIRELIKQIPVETTDAVLNQTRHVAADLQPPDLTNHFSPITVYLYDYL